MQADKLKISALIKSRAAELGFDLVGIAQAGRLQDHGEKIAEWCAAGMNGSMEYLSRNIEIRTDPSILFPGAKSLIVTGLNYFSEKNIGGDGIPVISRYAYGDNYHDIIIGKLALLLDYIKLLDPEAEGKSFVDSAPLLEKAWAQRAGLGWPGRHSVLINKHLGSFFFIGILITTLELEYDKPVTEDYCGTCRLCVDACPTSAINENRTIDVRKCIAYQTIEQKEPMPEEVVEKAGGRIFGCDICQEACPWNKHAHHHSTHEFEPYKALLDMTREDWNNLTKERFKEIFKSSAIGRKKYETFMENVRNGIRHVM
jgi:epoxyqueuosine reductase